MKEKDTSEVIEILQNALFLNRSETQRIGITDVHILLKRYGVIAGITKRLYPHLLRGSSATHMSNAGMSLVEIQAQTKHRCLETLTKHYINPSKERVKKVYTEVFNQFSDEKMPTPQSELKQPEPQPKPQSEDDKTDKYIALLEKGLIGKEDFLKLMISENKQQNLEAICRIRRKQRDLKRNKKSPAFDSYVRRNSTLFLRCFVNFYYFYLKD